VFLLAAGRPRRCAGTSDAGAESQRRRTGRAGGRLSRWAVAVTGRRGGGGAPLRGFHHRTSLPQSPAEPGNLAGVAEAATPTSQPWPKLQANWPRFRGGTAAGVTLTPTAAHVGARRWATVWPGRRPSPPWASIHPSCGVIASFFWRRCEEARGVLLRCEDRRDPLAEAGRERPAAARRSNRKSRKRQALRPRPWHRWPPRST